MAEEKEDEQECCYEGDFFGDDDEDCYDGGGPFHQVYNTKQV